MRKRGDQTVLSAPILRRGGRDIDYTRYRFTHLDVKATTFLGLLKVVSAREETSCLLFLKNNNQQLLDLVDGLLCPKRFPLESGSRNVTMGL
jgi:hypothetical protein